MLEFQTAINAMASIDYKNLRVIFMKLGIKTNTIPLLAGFIFLVLGLTVEFIQILQINQGHFIYTLDDAYIHLSLAENILQGHYGVNPGEFSSPSSSILWPFLLAPVSGIEWAPLVINLLAAFTTVWVYFQILQRSFSATRHGFPHLLIGFTLILLILSTDLIGLVFTGMEHSLQLLVIAVITWGLVLTAEGDNPPAWLYFSIGLAPLIRYENLAVSAAALLFLVLDKQFKKSLFTLAFILLSLGGFSLFLVSNGQSALPSSVLAKSSVVTEGFLRSFFYNFLYNIQTWFGVLSIILIVFLAGLILFAKMDRNRRRLAGITILAVVLQLWAGRVGWYRYELYMLAFMSLLTIYLVGRLISPWLDRPGTLLQWAAVTVGLSTVILFSNFPYIMLLAYIPESSNNVYSQHYEMHRFVTEYHPGPAAANDIGWLSYKNDAYVLDLYGLASPDAFRYRMAGKPDNWMDTLTTAHDIDLVMIYADWYPDIPPQWVKVGELVYHGRKITIAGTTVSFYATSQSAAGDIEQDLQDFIPSLPPNTSFVFTP